MKKAIVAAASALLLVSTLGATGAQAHGFHHWHHWHHWHPAYGYDGEPAYGYGPYGGPAYSYDDGYYDDGGAFAAGAALGLIFGLAAGHHHAWHH